MSNHTDTGPAELNLENLSSAYGDLSKQDRHTLDAHLIGACAAEIDPDTFAGMLERARAFALEVSVTQ